MTGKTRKMHWMAALLLIGTAGTTMAGPGLGPYGPWNRGGGGGGFNGMGPRQDFAVRGCSADWQASNYWVSQRPAREIVTTIRRAEPVAERITTVRQTRLIMPATTNRVWTKQYRVLRPANMVTTTTTELAPRQQLEVVGERITTIRPASGAILSAPACGTSDYLFR